MSSPVAQPLTQTAHRHTLAGLRQRGVMRVPTRQED